MLEQCRRYKRVITIDEARKELREYRDNIKYIDEKQSDSEELKDRIEKISSSSMDGLPKGRGINLDEAPFEESLDKIMQIREDCKEKLKELIIKKFMVENKIDQLEQPHKSILYMKYIRGINLYKVSEELGYSYQHIKRMHKEAIEQYANL